MTHTSFITTTRGLNRESPPMRLFEKAKNLGFGIHPILIFQKIKMIGENLQAMKKI